MSARCNFDIYRMTQTRSVTSRVHHTDVILQVLACVFIPKNNDATFPTSDLNLRAERLQSKVATENVELPQR